MSGALRPLSYDFVNHFAYMAPGCFENSHSRLKHPRLRPSCQPKKAIPNVGSSWTEVTPATISGGTRLLGGSDNLRLNITGHLFVSIQRLRVYPLPWVIERRVVA